MRRSSRKTTFQTRRAIHLFILTGINCGVSPLSMRTFLTKLRHLVTFDAHAPHEWVLWVIGVCVCMARFVQLESAPPGFFSDEFNGALHQVCIAQELSSASGERYPSFVAGGGGGLYTPPFLYLGALWQLLWGPSIATSRAFAALFGTLTVLGAAAFAARVKSVDVARWVFVAGALSPWGFQFSRIAWDPPMAPAFLMWAAFFWLGRKHAWQAIAAGLCLTMALYCYPPIRIQAPLFFAVMLGWGVYKRSVNLRSVALLGGTCLLAGLPLIQGTLFGTLNGRGNQEAIWSSNWLSGAHGRYSSWYYALMTFFDNLHAHFRPTYLFFMGDQNPRHSTQWFGEWGLLDNAALLVVVAAIVGFVWRHVADTSEPPENRFGLGLGKRSWQLLCLAVIGYFLGILSAALCWSGVPHALRSIGSWPFLALGTGVILETVTRKLHKVRWPLVGVAALHVGVFGYAYWGRFPKVAADWFDAPVKQAMLDAKLPAPERAELARKHPEAFRYFGIVARGKTCKSSRVELKKLLRH